MDWTPVPRPCPNHTSTFGLMGARTAAWCYAIAGYYGETGAAGDALPCPQDAYCPERALEPTPCPPGRYAPARSISSDACIPQMYPPCRAGYFTFFDVPAQCSQCPPGCYCAVGEALACCDWSPNGYWYTLAGASNQSACQKNQGQPAGTVQCPTGTYMDARYTPTSIAQCRAMPGRFYVPYLMGGATLCPAGYYCPDKTLQPVPCAALVDTCGSGGYYPAGARCATAGLSAPTDACIRCPSALPTYAAYTSPGRTCDFCCPVDFILYTGLCFPFDPTAASPKCGWGMHYPRAPACSVAMPACVPCPPSPMLDAVLVAPGICTYACPPGMCSANRTAACVLAPPGAFVNAVSGACELCPAGTYGPEAGASACLACPLWSLPTPSVGSTWCTCIGGTYLSATRAPMLIFECLACPPGMVSDPGALACTYCPPGTVCASAVSGACAPGTFRPLPRAPCQPCDIGYFASAGGATACERCAIGTYTPQHGASACTICTAGRIVTLFGECTACTGGTIATANRADCVCPTGMYMDLGTGTCLPCCAGAVLVGNTSSRACTAPGTRAGDFVCSAQECAFGWYYHAASGACRECRRCPPLATTISRCIAPSSADVCQCPLLYFHDITMQQCRPCVTCSPDGYTVSTCALGAVSDTTICACAANYTGDGVVCTQAIIITTTLI